MEPIDLGIDWGSIDGDKTVVAIAEFVDIDKYEFAVLLHSDGDHWLSPVGGNA